jgi:LacI family transcriptional regulator
MSELTAYLHNLVLGISDFARIHGQWQIFGLFIGRPSPSRAVEADAHGAIVFRGDPELIDPRIPAVCVGTRASGVYPPGSLRSDGVRIGEMAAEHLLERGLRTFSFVGDSQGSASADQRRDGFRRAVARAGGRYLDGPSLRADRFDEGDSLEAVADWIRSLPKPVGIMGINDVVARQVADACRIADQAVPDDVAIVGVDNEELMCMLADPPLSSVDPGSKRLGFEAAATLDRILSGEPPRSECVVMPPLGVVVRHSSDVLAIDDTDVAEAVRFIQNHCAQPISVSDVLRAVPVARRSLDRRFKQRTGRTIHDEIQHARIRRACELLVRTTLAIPHVAHQCGFSGREYFSTAFARVTGQPPAAYRRKFQVKSGV